MQLLDEVREAGKELNIKLAEEGNVLLKNDDCLPLGKEERGLGLPVVQVGQREEPILHSLIALFQRPICPQWESHRGIKGGGSKTLGSPWQDQEVGGLLLLLPPLGLCCRTSYGLFCLWLPGMRFGCGCGMCGCPELLKMCFP